MHDFHARWEQMGREANFQGTPASQPASHGSQLATSATADAAPSGARPTVLRFTRARSRTFNVCILVGALNGWERSYGVPVHVLVQVCACAYCHRERVAAAAAAAAAARVWGIACCMSPSACVCFGLFRWHNGV